MPKYTLNGKNYNIPDSLTQKFESQNPNATIAYSANGKNYNIPVNKRDAFLKAFPDAKFSEVEKKQQPQQPASAPEQTVAAPQEPQGPYKPTEMERMAMGMTIGSAQSVAENATKGIDQQSEAMKKMSPIGDGQAGLAYNKNLRKGDKSFNAETGQFEDTYMTTNGKTYKNPVEASNAQDYADYVGRVEGFRENLKALGLDNSDKDINKQIEEAHKELDNLDVEIDKHRYHQAATLARGMGLAGSHGSGTHETDYELDNLLTAKRMLERRIKSMEAKRDDSGFWKGTGNTLTDASSYSFGLSDLADSKAMKNISDKIAAGGDFSTFTESEKQLVRQYLLNQEANQLNQDNWWYTAGQGFGQTLSFMKDFAVTGGGFMGLAKGGMALGGKAGAKLATKTLGDYMTKNLGTKLLGKAMQTIGKGAGLVVGSELGGFALNNTIQAASSLADITNKQIGNLTIDKDGKLTFEGSKSLGDAFLSSQLSRTGENASELVGVAFDAVPGILGKVIQRTTAGKVLKRLTDTKFWKGGEKALDYLGVQSVWGEGMEEEYNMARDVLIGESGWFKDPNDPSKPAFFDGERQLDTWKTVGLTSMILRVPSMIVSGTATANYYGNKYNLNMSDNNMRDVFGNYYRYQNVKAMIDGADNQQIAGVLNNLMNNAELSRNEKEAMFRYANDLVLLRGFNIGNVVAAANGYQAPPSVSGYNVRGNTIEEVDENGNVLSTHEYENRDAMKAGLYELQQQRFDKNLQTDLSIMRARPGRQYDELLQNYCIDNRYTFEQMEEFEAILNKPSMERTEAEQQMVAPFADLLHNTVYDNTILHEEQSQKDGEEIADSDSIDMESSGEQGAIINTQWLEAQTKRKALFDSNEDLRQEVERMENENLSHQEIISNLETFSPDEVQTVIDYYNTKAKYEGYVNRMARKIDEEAANSRQRHAFKGTINGQADLSNVYTISDGTNEYFLVSGNVTTDRATGQITGSDSGLVIGMDLDGSFVQISDTNGYSVMPSTQTLDQFEEAERIRLQEEWTAKIDPTGSMQQPTEQSGNLDNAGGEASVNGDTGANNPPATATVQQQEQPAVTIENVTDEDGVKHYENGIPVDQAIDDMQADNVDVLSEADLAINEAQTELSKIKEPKTRAERSKNDKKRQELQNIIDYWNQIKNRYNELHPQYADAAPYIDQINKATSKKKADEILSQALQAGVNPEEIQPVHTQKVSDLITKEEEARRQANDITDKDILLVRQYKDTPEGRAWLLNRKRVPSAEKRRKLAKLIYGDEFDDDFEAWRDERELISLWLSKDRALDPDSFGKELGWDMSVGKDSAKVSTMFTAKRENGGDGMLFNDFVHMVMEASGGRFTTEDIRNTLIRMFQEAQEKSDLTEYQLTTRVAQAEKALRDAEQRLADAAEEEEIEEGEPADTGQLPFAPANENEERPAFLGEEEQKEEPETPQEPEQPQQQSQGRDEYLASHPLTEEQIMADTEATEDEKLNAIDFLNGEDSVISRFYYDQIYERAQSNNNPAEKKPTVERDSWIGTTEEEFYPAVKEWLDAGNSVSVSGVQRHFKVGYNKATKAIERYKEEKNNSGQQPKWQYQFHYDKETGRAWITRDDVSGSIPIGDGRFRIEGRSLSELRGILENPKNNLGELLKEVETQLHNAEALEKWRRENDPMAAIEDAARLFRGEQKSKDQQDIDDALKEFNDFLDNAKGSNVLDKFMRKGIEGNDKLQANLLDAFTLTNEAQRMFLKDLLRLASKVGYAYIKSGVHDVQAWSKQMSETIGQKLREVLGWDDAIVGEFVDEVWNQKYTVDGQRMRLSEHAERLKNEKPADQTVNVNKQEDNEPEKDLSLQGDSAEFADRQQKIDKLSKAINNALFMAAMSEDVKLKTMQNVKALAKEYGLEDISLTDLQELVEAEIVNVARDISLTEALNDEQKFANIKRLYERQPTLSARDNDRINKQQYSTPAPMAFLMGKFLTDGKEVNSGLEPSAGNGMLTINLPKEKMHVNDIDEMRLSNLEKQGFGQVTSQDGLQPFEQKAYDVVVTNPPFGNTTPKVYDGIYEISGLEHQMAINALESMKDDGKAAIIIGGNTEYNQNGSIKGKDRIFLNYLYAHYNVVDVINMDGKSLYTKQGTGYPVRMILINGRKEFNAKDFAPVQSKARAERVNSYDELYKRVNDDILSDTNKPASVHNTESGKGRRVDDTSNAGTSTETGVRNGGTQVRGEQHPVLDRRGQSVQGSPGRTEEGTDTGGSEQLGEGDSVVLGAGQETTQSGGNTSSQTDEGRGVSERRDGSERPDGRVDVSVRGGSRPSVEVRRLGAEKVPYRQQSTNPYSLQSQMPAEQADVVKKALEELGDVDEFLVKELGYSSVEDLHHGSQSPENHGGLAAEQVDSVAMAIHQMNQGNAFIIGDQTGVGKGRQAAALIRYGVKKGGCPVFISVKKGLFSDMYRDLCDIGSPELRPFIWSADDDEHSADVTDKNGNVVYKRPNDKEQKRVVDYINKHGKLPPEYDYIVTTYDSFKGGTMTYEEGKKSARKFPKGKSATTGAINSQAKRDALERLAENSYVIMDESHNAGGENSAVSGYLQYITTRAKGVTFLSATFAKRPGNMPIYSLKTAISKAGVKVGELIDAVKRGGATFQEIMSKALTEAGQMIRRERNMEGVTIDWKGIEDEDVIQKQREQYDEVIGLFNDIINFQRTYVDPIVDGMNDDEADNQGSVDHTPGTRDMGINNTPFASRTYNMVQQVLLSLKAEETAKRAIEHLKAGRKPVIALANTNEGAADEAAGSSEESMEMPDLSVNLKKGLRGTLRITKKDAFGNTQNEEIPFERLSPEGQARYQEIMDAIENASTGLSLSPIDVIKNELKKAGYKVGELTGRKAEFIYNEDGTVKRVKRADKDKKKIAADFNNGKLDALILNKSAGTGISLHASSKFDDQRQRVMIVAQAQGDVNDEVQIRGRIDRTGQVLRGMYEYVVSQIPSEQRLLMMLKAKLRSLDANTTSSQKSKFNEMQVQDIINKYGDDIVVQYLAEHTDLAEKMQNPLKWQADWQVMPSEQLVAEAQKDGEAGKTASKVLGRMALLTVKEQEKMLAEIGDLYQAEIDRLNEMGENDLEITEMPLKAKTLSKAVWEQGIEPGGKNPFADNTYVEKVQMDVLKKPMKSEEVKKSQERLLGGKTWEEYKQEQLAKVDKWEEQKKAETRETITERAKKKAEAEKEKYIKGAKKAQEKNGMTDEEIEKNGGYQYDTFYKQEMEKLDNALAGIEAQKQVFVDALEMFNTDNVYAIPSNIYDLGSITFEPGLGKLIDIKISDNFSTSASTITFATLDGRRKITIPISGRVKQQNNEKREIFPVINSLTAQTKQGMFGSNVANTQKVLEQNMDNWDKLTSTAARKDGYIITGNLLKALVSTREQHVGGKLISYTTDTGEVRQGILMPDNFEPAGLTSKTPISAKKDELKYPRDKVESADGNVLIRVTSDWDWNDRAYNTLEITVPKSNKKGAKYFNDETLLSLMDGQFEGSGKMRAEFKRSNLDAVMKRLDELGVTITEEHKEDESPKRMITSSDPMEAINQASEAWREERGKSAISDKAKAVEEFINDLPKRFGIEGGVPVYVVKSADEIEALRGKLGNSAIDVIKKDYNDPDIPALYLTTSKVVVIFGDKVESVKDAEISYWHEQTHSFWATLPDDVREIFGEACFKFLEKNYPLVHKHIMKYYSEDLWHEEACSFLMGETVAENGTEKLLNDNFVGNDIICTFANRLRNYIKYGKQEGNNQLRRNEVGQGTEVSRRSEKEREGRDSGLRSEKEQVTDPMQAIEESARQWRKERKDRIEGAKELGEYSAKKVYHERLNHVISVIQEAWQDAMIAFKHGQNAIAQDKDIPDSQNAYQAANLAFGRIYNQQEQFTDIYRKPLEETIYQVCEKMDWQTGDVDRYVFTKHGFERNRELFVRDWMQAQRNLDATYEMLDDERQEAYDKIANRLEEQVEDGDITEEQRDKKLEQALDKLWQEQLDQLQQDYVDAKEEAYQKLMKGEINFAEYLQAIDDFIHNNIDKDFDAEKNDCSGFTEMFGKGYKEKDILDKLMADEEKMGKELMDKMWSQINLCSQLGLDKYRESGMITDDTYKRVTNMFHFYVPMRGFGNDTAAQDHWQYMTVKDGANTIGGLLKTAKGRKSEANYPLSTLFAITYKAISDGEQNMVKQKFYRLCQANPNDLVTIQDTWAVLDNTTGEWVVDYPKISEDMSPQEVEARTREFYERMDRLQLEGKAKKVSSKAKFDYRVDSKRKKEHIVEVSINGKRKTMIIKGNPRMAQALNGTLHYERGSGKWNEMVANMKQFQQSVSTSYNLTFVGRNMARDWTHFGAILQAREGWDYEKAAQKYYWSQMPHMVSLFKKYREGSLDMSNEMERDFKDFMDNGGITGFVHMQKVEELQKEMEKLLSTPGKVKKVSNAFWDKTLGAVEAMNEAIENNARFATYRASRHQAGRTKARSAFDAKEVTVNFNKRGAGKKTSGFKTDKKWVHRAAVIAGETAQILMANKMFFNATVQAICNIFRNVRNADGTINKKYVERLVGYYAIPPFAMGLLMPVINQALYALAGGDDGDDPYANLPEWVRRKNLCVYTGWIPGCGKNDFLVIPMGQELAAFYSMGDMMAGITYRPSLKPVDKNIVDEMIGFFNVFSPVDFETQITSGDRFAPVSEVVGRICSPAAPLVAVGENMAWMGRPIYREDRFQGDGYTPEYQMTLGNTNSAYISLSKWLNDVSGGDDVKRGWIQINPGAMQYVFEQYVGGPGKFFMNTGSAMGDAYNAAFTDNEHDFNIRKVEFVRAFWQQGDERTELYRAKAKYRKYREDANEYYQNLKGYSDDAATNPEHYTKALEMSKGKDFVRMQMVREADKYLKKLNTAANQAEGKDRKNLRALYNNALAKTVEELDKVQDIE